MTSYFFFQDTNYKSGQKISIITFHRADNMPCLLYEYEQKKTASIMKSLTQAR